MMPVHMCQTVTLVDCYHTTTATKTGNPHEIERIPVSLSRSCRIVLL